jgi:hypothetical protein
LTVVSGLLRDMLKDLSVVMPGFTADLARARSSEMPEAGYSGSCGRHPRPFFTCC